MLELFPTPKARDSQAEGYEAGLRRASPQVGTIVKGIVEKDNRVLFPTPVAQDTSGAMRPQDRAKSGQGYGPALRDISHLLRTPQATDGEKGSLQTATQKSKGGGQIGLYHQINELPETNWGRFEPAIKRWASIIGRPAPAPTKPDGREGTNRLSSLFTEWLMGLPEGWITGLGLKRNDELKLAGNGVVPQQAELALRILLQDNNLLERIKK
jgi:DNA (cytosine-5)-methyltransferase 1